ncbi:MAG: SDR family oxidoreductase [Nitrososphaeraceae archaeon]
MKVQDLFDLRDKVAVVTGGSGYLGLYISEGLIEAGAKVFIASRSKVKNEKAIELLQDKIGSKVRSLVLDVRSMESVKECFNEVVRDAGKIDILVNNATVSVGQKLEDISETQWNEGIDGTINGVFRTTKTVIPIMQHDKSGSIINIASMYGTVSPDPSIYENTDYYSSPNYGAGKSAIIQFTRYTACYLAKTGIRINAVSPGPFPNPEVQKNRLFISRLERKTPLGRIGQPDELKGIIVFLASKASSFVTGANIPVDGGWTAW